MTYTILTTITTQPFVQVRVSPEMRSVSSSLSVDHHNNNNDNDGLLHPPCKKTSPYHTACAATTSNNLFSIPQYLPYCVTAFKKECQQAPGKSNTGKASTRTAPSAINILPYVTVELAENAESTLKSEKKANLNMNNNKADEHENDEEDIFLVPLNDLMTLSTSSVTKDISTSRTSSSSSSSSFKEQKSNKVQNEFLLDNLAAFRELLDREDFEDDSSTESSFEEDDDDEAEVDEYYFYQLVVYII